jgi:growth differentiation factor 8/11
MEVSFEEMGWDWVIEPKRFKAGYCEGPCSASTDLHESTATNGTEATQQANMKTECCQPTRTDPLYILYMDDTMAISYQRMDGMIITECGCQQSTKC